MTEETLVALLRAKFDPHAILLYGSRARGDATAQSDWDVSCIAVDAEPHHYGWVEDGAFLDVFVYPAFEPPKPEDLRMLGSRILLDEHGLALPFLQELAALDARGPDPLPAHQVAMEKTWIDKTLQRARRGLEDPSDLEAHYRRHWLLRDLLEYAFTLRNQWFSGAKAAFALMQQSDPALYALFAAAYAPDAPFESIERLALAVAALEAPRRTDDPLPSSDGVC